MQKAIRMKTTRQLKEIFEELGIDSSGSKEELQKRAYKEDAVGRRHSHVTRCAAAPCAMTTLLDCIAGSSPAAAENITDGKETQELLPLLIQLPGGPHRCGSFLEIGANDGVSVSQTFGLERCLGWSGLLVEAVSSTFEQLQRAPRSPRTRKIRSAVCNQTDGGMLRFTRASGTGSAVNLAIDSSANKAYLDLWSKRWKVLNLSDTEEVPCKPLGSIMDDAGFHDRIDFLSLDVQGAEATVLETVDPRRFGMVLTEAEGVSARSNARVDAMLLQAGFRQLPLDLYGPHSTSVKSKGVNKLYLAPDVYAHLQDVRAPYVASQMQGDTPEAGWLKRRARLEAGLKEAGPKACKAL